jgi:hypothetical protein
MSSATSIEPADAKELPALPEKPKGASGGRDSFQAWHFFVLMSLLAATVAVIMARQSSPEQLIILSLTIGAAGFAAAALYRTLVPLVGSELSSLDQPLTESGRALIEREKLLALRAIKELEFDRAMGKVSAKDFDEMASRLRSRAITLMRKLDANAGYRELIERELAVRGRMAAGARKAPAVAAPSAPASGVCACGTSNDSDAAFCKRCGSKLAASGPA